MFFLFSFVFQSKYQTLYICLAHQGGSHFGLFFPENTDCQSTPQKVCRFQKRCSSKVIQDGIPFLKNNLKPFSRAYILSLLYLKTQKMPLRLLQSFYHFIERENMFSPCWLPVLMVEVVVSYRVLQDGQKVHCHKLNCDHVNSEFSVYC